MPYIIYRTEHSRNKTEIQIERSISSCSILTCVFFVVDTLINDEINQGYYLLTLCMFGDNSSNTHRKRGLSFIKNNGEWRRWKTKHKGSTKRNDFSNSEFQDDVTRGIKLPEFAQRSQQDAVRLPAEGIMRPGKDFEIKGKRRETRSDEMEAAISCDERRWRRLARNSTGRNWRKRRQKNYNEKMMDK